MVSVIGANCHFKKLAYLLHQHRGQFFYAVRLVLALIFFSETVGIIGGRKGGGFLQLPIMSLSQFV